MKKADFFDALKGAFAIKKNPLPWTKAICAGICSSSPVMIGLLLGNFQYGLLAGIGSFAYLYVWNEPYPQRAKKIFLVAAGLSASIGIGSLLAFSPLLFAILIGAIGAVCTFIFGALKIPGPASIFFVIVFAMTSAMPFNPSLAPLRAGLVFLGGAFAWLIAMSGWFFNPHGPEIQAVKRVYSELASLLPPIGTEQFNKAREDAVLALKNADTVLLGGYVSWQSSITFKRLYLLKEQANSILSSILDISAEGGTKPPPELADSVQAISLSLDHKKKSSPLKILWPQKNDIAVDRLFSKIYDIDAILNEPISRINQEINMTKPNIKNIFLDAFDKNSIVFISSLKYGIVLMAASMIAFVFEFDRSYWIPISCGAVMLGSTIMSTFHRAIQRAIGTIVGILVATIILGAEPHGITVAFFIMILNFFTELFIVRNYAFAVMFITPNSLLMAESTSQIHNPTYFATTRITDILIGCAIGLIGVLLVGRRSASSRLPHLMAKTIRSQAQLFFLLFSDQKGIFNFAKSNERNKMRTNLINLKTVYHTALGEVPNNKKALEFLWPAIFSIEQIGYLLDSSTKISNRPILSNEIIGQFLFVFETMATIAKHQESIANKNDVPAIKGFTKIQKEIISLQDALQLFQVKARSH